MATINKATTEHTNKYYWNSRAERFEYDKDDAEHFGCHTIIADAHLSAQQLDTVLNEAIAGIKH